MLIEERQKLKHLEQVQHAPPKAILLLFRSDSPRPNFMPSTGNQIGGKHAAQESETLRGAVPRVRFSSFASVSPAKPAALWSAAGQQIHVKCLQDVHLRRFVGKEH